MNVVGDKADTTDREVVLERVFDAPRELVFEAWTKPEHVARWFGPRGFTITTQEMDVRTGGRWRLIMHGPDGTDYDNLLVYTEVVRPERIAYYHTSGEEDDPNGFQGVVTFEELAPNKTRLTMRSVFQTPEALEHVVKEFGAIEGGKQTLDRLGEFLQTLAR